MTATTITPLKITPMTVAALAAAIPDGACIALPPDYSGCAMTAVTALIRRRARDLHLIGVPSLGFQGDWLIGAGCVRTVETAAMTLGEFGLPPRFNAAIKAGQLVMKDATCPAIHAGLQAAEKGSPYMPLRGILGSDLLKVRPDWKVMDNPFAPPGDKIVLIPAIRPDVALFHAAKADRYGNVWIGVRRELMLMAHAARATYVTVEEIVEFDLLRDEALAAGTIPGLYISGVAVAKRGAYPVGLVGAYAADEVAMAAYVKAAQTADGFNAWLDKARVGELV
jgi:glutaconate CoA-transferase, subunit A